MWVLFLLFHLFTFLTFSSCSERQEAMQFDADSTGIDTTMLRVAVMPAMSCLPVYYAEWTGLDDSLGVEMELLRFQAQMDVDTAILYGHTEIAFTDLSGDDAGDPVITLRRQRGMKGEVAGKGSERDGEHHTGGETQAAFQQQDCRERGEGSCN